jgi:hypothetical protein
MATTRESPFRSPLVRGMFALLVAVFMILSAISLWDEVELSIRGISASGKVLEHHGLGGHTQGCTAEVEVSPPGSASYRTPMSDGFGDACEDGSIVRLICAQDHAGGHSCEIDSWTRWLFPSAILGIGAGLIVWRMRRASNN